MSIEPAGGRNAGAAVKFLAGWVTDGETEARQHLAGHSGDDGVSLLARFRDLGIPLLHQISVAGPHQRRGVATLLSLIRV